MSRLYKKISEAKKNDGEINEIEAFIKYKKTVRDEVQSHLCEPNLTDLQRDILMRCENMLDDNFTLSNFQSENVALQEQLTQLKFGSSKKDLLRPEVSRAIRQRLKCGDFFASQCSLFVTNDCVRKLCELVQRVIFCFEPRLIIIDLERQSTTASPS